MYIELWKSVFERHVFVLSLGQLIHISFEKRYLVKKPELNVGLEIQGTGYWQSHWFLKGLTFGQGMSKLYL